MAIDLEDILKAYAVKYESISKAEKSLMFCIDVAIKEMSGNETLRKLNFQSGINVFDIIYVCGRPIKFSFHKDVTNKAGYWDWIFPEFNPDKGIEDEYLIFTCKYNSENNLTRGGRACNFERENIKPFLIECIYDFSRAVDDRILKKYSEK